uniref:Uncharacterized protein n=1 Tax=uncultured Armatimonadetes bacterium TaxID=157466 RepID=A0A6J4HKT0_9BACT|nr:hypothetical protein AVDCRST_MAG63-678 [uncultured Armatimonadetes bacterium]
MASPTLTVLAPTLGVTFSLRRTEPRWRRRRRHSETPVPNTTTRKTDA